LSELKSHSEHSYPYRVGPCSSIYLFIDNSTTVSVDQTVYTKSKFNCRAPHLQSGSK